MKRVLGLVLTAMLLALAGAAVPVSASAAQHHKQNPVFKIHEENGSQYVGAFSLSAGNKVITVPATSARTTTWILTGGTYFGNDVGRLQFSNGNYMAENTNCDGVTIKSVSTSWATRWALYITGGHEYLINEDCDNNVGAGNSLALGATNTNGAQWTLFDALNPQPGHYTKLLLA